MDGPGWRHELKYDGYRNLAEIDDGNVRARAEGEGPGAVPPERFKRG